MCSLTSILIFIKTCRLVSLITGITDTGGIIEGTESVYIYMKPYNLVIILTSLIIETDIISLTNTSSINRRYCYNS